jgi:hypothetical protein
MKKIRDLFWTLPLVLFTSEAHSWGRIGHEATAIIAYDHLSVTARSKIDQLTQRNNLLEASLWPDTIRAQAPWAHTKPFHFTNVTDGSNYYESIERSTPLERANGDALRALVAAEDVLRSSKATAPQKLSALKFLVHFLGDIHQPLHTGRPQDLGGNRINLTWFGRKNNLHSVWDTGIILARLEGRYIYRSEITNELEHYLSLLPKITSSQVRAWQQGSFLEWHDESLSHRDGAYASVGMDNAEAVAKFYALIDQRIQQAGVRIAGVLNSIFDSKPLSPQGVEFRRQLDQRLGAGHGREISLNPKNASSFKKSLGPIESHLLSALSHGPETECHHDE